MLSTEARRSSFRPVVTVVSRGKSYKMDIEWVIYHMIHNDDEGFTSVSFDIDVCRADVDQWDRLLEGLSRNRTLTRLDLVRGLQRMVATEADLQQLFSAMRRIPNLSEVRFDCFSTEDIELADCLFVENATLHSVLIENVRVIRNARNDNRYDGIVESLGAVRCLRSLHVEIPTENEPVQVPFAPLLLSQTSNLETFVIESTSSVPFIDPHFEAIAQTLATSNSHLQRLDIDLRVSPSGLENVAAMLSVNHSLKDLRLHIHASIQEHPQVTTHFLDVLKATNQGLHKFANYGLLSYTPTSDLIQAEFEMLEANLVLESFAMFNEEQETRTKREMFLRLNEMGRKNVHTQRESVARATWISQLAKHSDDLDCLFYYLGSNPSLCQLEETRELTTNESDVDRKIQKVANGKKDGSATSSTDESSRLTKRQRTEI
jgi:hypothetical protein